MAVRVYDAEMQGKGALWEIQRPWEWLMTKKHLMPTVMYNAQYRNDPAGLKGVRYDTSWLHYYNARQLPPMSSLLGIQAGDPATSEKSTANYFGHCTAGKDTQTGLVYVLDLMFGNIPAPDHLSYMKTQYDIWRSKGLAVHKVLLETGGPQQSVTQNLIAQTRMDKSGAMPIEEFKPKGSKEERFDTIQVFFKNATVLFKGEYKGDKVEMADHSGFQEFLTEYQNFPRGGRDDVFDAVYIACQELVSGIAAAMVDVNPDEMQAQQAEQNENESENEKKARRLKEYEDYVVNKGQRDARDRILARSGRPSLFHSRRTQ